MADNFFQGASADWTNVANWSSGAAPVDTEEVFIDRSAQDLSSNLDQRSVADIDLARLKIGGTYTGSIGSVASALMLDDVTTLEIDLAGPHTQVISLDLDGVTDAVILGTGSNDYACYLKDGSYANLYIVSGKVYIAAGMTITGRLYLLPDSSRPPPEVYIESGAAITGEIWAARGQIISDAAIAASRTILTGTATFSQEGASTVNVTNTIYMSGASKLLIQCGVAATIGRIITTEDAYVDSTLSPYLITYTNADAPGGRWNTKASDNFTNAPGINSHGAIQRSAAAAVVVPGFK